MIYIISKFKLVNNKNLLIKISKITIKLEKRSNDYDVMKWVKSNDTLKSIVDFNSNINLKKLLDFGTGAGKVIVCFKRSIS